MFHALIIFLIDVIYTSNINLLLYNNKTYQNLSNYVIGSLNTDEFQFSYNNSYIWLNKTFNCSFGSWTQTLNDKNNNTTNYDIIVYYIEKPKINISNTQPLIIICNETVNQSSEKLDDQNELILDHLYTSFSSFLYENLFHTSVIIFLNNQSNNNSGNRTKETKENIAVNVTSKNKSNNNIELFSLNDEAQEKFIFQANEPTETTNIVGFLNKNNVIIRSCESSEQLLIEGVGVNPFKPKDFYCIVNKGYTLQFDLILNDSKIKDEYNYSIIKNISYENATNNIITEITNNSSKQIYWQCQLIENNTDNILYSKETSELTLIGTNQQSNTTITLLTFTIKPIVPIEIGNIYEEDINNLKAYKQYVFDVPLVKCLNDNCIPYYRNLEVSFLNTTDTDNVEITLNFVSNNFLHLNILYTGSKDKVVNITLMVKESIFEQTDNETNKQEIELFNITAEKNLSFAFHYQTIPSFSLNGNDLQVLKEYEDLTTNQSNILYVPFFQIRFFIFMKNDSKMTENGDVIKSNISDFINSIRIFNQPSGMTINQNENNNYFEISYSHNLTSNLTIFILILNKEEIGVYIPLTIVPYYDYVFNNKTTNFVQSTSYVEELIPSNIDNNIFSSLDYLIDIENAYKYIYSDTSSQIIEDIYSYHITNDSKTFYFSPNLEVDSAISYLFNFSASFTTRGENKTVYFTRILNVSKDCFGLFIYNNNIFTQIRDNFEINLYGNNSSFEIHTLSCQPNDTLNFSILPIYLGPETNISNLKTNILYKEKNIITFDFENLKYPTTSFGVVKYSFIHNQKENISGTFLLYHLDIEEPNVTSSFIHKIKENEIFFISYQFFNPWLPRTQFTLDETKSNGGGKISLSYFNKNIFNDSLVFDKQIENYNFDNGELILYPSFTYHFSEKNTPQLFSIKHKFSIIHHLQSKIVNSKGKKYLNTLCYDTLEDQYSLSINFTYTHDSNRELCYYENDKNCVNNTSINSNQTYNYTWNRGSDYFKTFTYTINNNEDIYNVSYTICVTPSCADFPDFNLSQSNCTLTENGKEIFVYCPPNETTFELTNLHLINGNTTIKLGIFDLDFLIEGGGGKINLPIAKYSQCLPLLIYSNDSQIQGAGAYVKYFFSLTSQQNETLNFTINRIEPETFPLSYTEVNASSISIFGERFSPDMRCFIKNDEMQIEEVQFLYSNESYVGCLLPTQLENKTNKTFNVILHQRGCNNNMFNVTKSFSIKENLEISNDLINSDSINNLTEEITLKYTINGLIKDIPNSVVVIYNDMYYYFLNSNNDSRIQLNYTNNKTNLFFDAPIIDSNFSIKISLDYGTTFKEFNYNLDDGNETCQAGYFCVKKNDNSYYHFFCPPGTYSKENDLVCQKCEKGKMCPSEGMKEPENCFPGYICDEEGIIFPTKKCPGGQACFWKNNETIQENCIQQHYCEDGVGKSYSTALEESSFGSQSDEHYGGMYTFVDESFRPVFNLVNNNSWYYNYEEDVKLKTADFFELYMKTSTPIQCIKGFQCPAGMSRIWGKGACFKGFYCPENPQKVNEMLKIYGSNYTCNDSNCQCPEGFYCNRDGMEAPIPCEPGTFSNKTESVSCELCPQGMYCPNRGSNGLDKKNCTPGHYCPAGSSQEIECNTGYYQKEYTQSNCKICPDGKECINLGTINPQNCTPGYVCNGNNDSYYERKPCPGGKFCLGGNGEKNPPINCPIGSKCPEGSAKNQICQPRTFSYKNGSINCTECIIGFYCEKANSSLNDLTECSEGHICNQPGLMYPEKKCEEGYVCLNKTYFTKDVIQKVIKEINITSDEEYLVYNELEKNREYYFQKAKSSSKFIEKLMEKINKTLNSLYPNISININTSDFMWPLKCPSGYKCLEFTGPVNSTVSNVPRACGKGTFQNENGQSQCKNCLIGYYCNNTINKIPIHCPIGHYRNTTLTCVPCPVGTFLNHSNSDFNIYDDGNIYKIKTNYSEIIKNLTNHFIEDISKCDKCPAGYLCNETGTENYTKYECPQGYICKPGTSALTGDMICPEGKYCVLGSKSYENIPDCPAGRYCILGTGASKEDEEVCNKTNIFLENNCVLQKKKNEKNCTKFGGLNDLTNRYDVIKKCKIGKECPGNHYCPKGTGSTPGPIKCPTFTFSEKGTDTVTDCKLNSVDRYNYYDYEIKSSKTQIDQFSSYFFTFNRAVLETNDNLNGYQLELGRDYDIVIKLSLDTQDSRNKRFLKELQEKDSSLVEEFKEQTIYLVENLSKSPGYISNYLPYLKVPLMKDLIVGKNNPDFANQIEFVISSSFPCTTSFYFRSINPVLEKVDSFIKALSLGKIDNYDIIELNKAISSETKNFFITQYTYNFQIKDPSNSNIYPNYVTQDNKRENKLHRLATASLYNFKYLKNAKGIQTSTPKAISKIGGFQKKNNFYSQFIPYITNCEKLGAYIPLWRLFSYQEENNNNSCSLFDVLNTTSVSYYYPKTSIGDECHLSFQCLYNENLAKTSGTSNSPWIYSPSTSSPLFYISKTIVRNPNDFFGYGESDENIEFVEVNPQTDYSLTNYYYPQTITLEISYYQYTSALKKITKAKIKFGNLTRYSKENDELGGNNYTFHFDFYPLEWVDIMKNFHFPTLWYLTVILLIISAYVSIYVILNVIAKKTNIHGGKSPHYPIKFSFFQTLNTFLGVIGSISVLIFPIIIGKYFANYFSLNFLFHDEIADTPFGIRGRIGSFFLVFGLVSLGWITRMMLPRYNPYDKRTKEITTKIMTQKEIIELMEQNRKEVYAFGLWIILLSIICSMEYLYYSYVLMVINKQKTRMNSILLSGIQMVSVQIIDQINMIIIDIFAKTFSDPFYTLPLTIVSSFIIKVMQFQISDFVTFMLGYLQSSVLSSLVNRLLLHSLLPLFRMRFEDYQKKQQNIRLTAESYISDQVKKEQLVTQLLSSNSIQISTTLILVAHIAIRYLFFNEMNNTDNEEFYFYYILLTLILMISEIPLDSIINNIIECWSDFNLKLKTETFREIYQNINKTWVINDLTYLSSPQTKDLSLIERLGFSWQYYFILSFCCCSITLIILGFDLVTVNNYNLFADYFCILFFITAIGYFIVINQIVQSIFIFFDRRLQTKYECLKEKVNYSEIKPLLKYNKESIKDMKTIIYQNKLNNKDFISLLKEEILREPERFIKYNEEEKLNAFILATLESYVMKNVPKLKISLNDEIIFSLIDEFASACVNNYIAKQAIDKVKESEEKEKEGKNKRKENKIQEIIAKKGEKKKKNNKKRKKYEDLFFSLDNSWYTDLDYSEEEKNYMSICKKTNQILNRKVESNISYSYNINVCKKIKKTLKNNKNLKGSLDIERSSLMEESETSKSPIRVDNYNDDEIILKMSDNDDL